MVRRKGLRDQSLNLCVNFYEVNVSGVITPLRQRLDTIVQLKCRIPSQHGHGAQCQCPLVS